MSYIEIFGLSIIGIGLLYFLYQQSVKGANRRQEAEYNSRDEFSIISYLDALVTKLNDDIDDKSFKQRYTITREEYRESVESFNEVFKRTGYIPLGMIKAHEDRWYKVANMWFEYNEDNNLLGEKFFLGFCNLQKVWKLEFIQSANLNSIAKSWMIEIYDRSSRFNLVRLNKLTTDLEIRRMIGKYMIKQGLNPYDSEQYQAFKDKMEQQNDEMDND